MTTPAQTIVEFIIEQPTSIDKVYIDVLEDLVCTHTTGVDGVIYNDHTDLGGDVGHVNYYCERCGKLMRQEY